MLVIWIAFYAIGEYFCFKIENISKDNTFFFSTSFSCDNTYNKELNYVNNNADFVIMISEKCRHQIKIIKIKLARESLWLKKSN